MFLNKIKLIGAGVGFAAVAALGFWVNSILADNERLENDNTILQQAVEDNLAAVDELKGQLELERQVNKEREQLEDFLRANTEELQRKLNDAKTMLTLSERECMESDIPVDPRQLLRERTRPVSRGPTRMPPSRIAGADYVPRIHW